MPIHRLLRGSNTRVRYRIGTVSNIFRNSLPERFCHVIIAETYSGESHHYEIEALDKTPI